MFKISFDSLRRPKAFLARYSSYPAQKSSVSKSRAFNAIMAEASNRLSCLSTADFRFKAFVFHVFVAIERSMCFKAVWKFFLMQSISARL